MSMIYINLPTAPNCANHSMYSFNAYFGSFHCIKYSRSTNVSLAILAGQIHSTYIRPLHSYFIRDTFHCNHEIICASLTLVLTILII
jgi:hypothetical protein